MYLFEFQHLAYGTKHKKHFLEDKKKLQTTAGTKTNCNHTLANTFFCGTLANKKPRNVFAGL